MSIEPGMIYEISQVVEESHTAAAIAGEKLPHVLSTPHLIGVIETSAHEAIAAALNEDQSSVGTFIAVKHIAATPVGMQIRVRIEVLQVTERKVAYKVEAWDAVEKIAEGEHERFVIDVNRFAKNVEKKQQLLIRG
ncbi:MAG: thioesterase [Chloroflexi bacterium HGW-Chloroflexi-10]|nr:MAG: thioesterase [Chloroflexi bacterium HGW-Chloroflexi-10]